MKNSSANLRKVVVAGVMSAIAVLLAVTNLGLITWGTGVSLTIMHIPVIIGTILEGPVVGIITGAIFGITSLIRAAVAPTGPIDPFFTNPLVSVLPRLLIGVMTWLAYKAFQGKLELAAVITAAVVGSLTNTLLVLSMLALVNAIPWSVIITVILGNGLLEAAVAAVSASIIVLTWKGIDGRKTRSSLADIEEE